MIETTAAKYLEFLTNDSMNNIIAMLESEDISDDEMETIYAKCYYFFSCGNYAWAKAIFSTLTAYAPYTSHYWRSLDAVTQQMKNYAEAITAYDMAIANDETDLVSYVYRAESQILSGNVEAGLRDPDEVVKIGAMYPLLEAWMKRAKLLLRTRIKIYTCTLGPASYKVQIITDLHRY